MDIILLFEGIAFLCSLWLLHPRNDKTVRLLIAVTTTTAIVEGIGYYYKNILQKPNHQFYNISVPLIILLFLLLLQSHVKRNGYRKFITAGMLTFVLFAIINATSWQGPAKFCTYTYILGALFLAVATSFYFLEMIRQPSHITLNKEPMFWISTGVLILYLPKCILYAVFEYLAYHNEVMDSFGATFHLLNKVLSVIFFSCLSYASLCRLIYRN